MLIDCETCRAPQQACQDCVMTVLLGPAPRPVRLDDGQRDALGALAGAGLVPPLRLVVGVTAGQAEPDSQLDPDEDAGARPDAGVRGIA